MHSSPSSLDSPDDDMGDGSSHLLKIMHSSPREEPSQPEEPKGGAFSSTKERKGETFSRTRSGLVTLSATLLKSEVRIGNIVGELVVDETIEQ